MQITASTLCAITLLCLSSLACKKKAPAERPTTSSATKVDAETLELCAASSLNWQTAHKTWYESYPDPGSEECIEYNGCTWAGQFAACDGVQSKAWVAKTNIASAFPSFSELENHRICLRSGKRTMIVNVIDTCADSDCDGCCTQNKGDADQLIDLEKGTQARWGLPDGKIEWADLGPAPSVCEH